LRSDSAHKDWHCGVAKELPWEILWWRKRGKKNMLDNKSLEKKFVRETETMKSVGEEGMALIPIVMCFS